MTTNAAVWGAEKTQANGSILSGIVARMRQSWSRRRTHLLLADLDDHTLDDIGVDPSHVRRTRPGAVDWVLQTHSGTARLVFIGR